MTNNGNRTKVILGWLAAMVLCGFFFSVVTPGAAAAEETQAVEVTEEPTDATPEVEESTDAMLEAEESTDATLEAEETSLPMEPEQSNPVDDLFERLMASATQEEWNAVLEAMTDEERAYMAQFTQEQNTALSSKEASLGGAEPAAVDEQAEEVAPDAAFLWITKTFVGIDVIPTDYSISIDDQTYTASSPHLVSNLTDDHGNIVLKWKIPVMASASYRLQERGAGMDRYNLTAEPSGVLDEDGVTVSVDASRISMTWRYDINECSNQVFTLSKDHVFIVAAKSNVIVLSAAPLGATARAALIEEIKTFSGDFKHNNGQTVFFYQISQYLGQTITIDGTSVTVSEDGTTATIHATKEWTKVKNYQYGYEAAQTDISITNTYRPRFCSMSVRKNVSGNMADRNKGFRFTAALSGGDYSFAGVTYSVNGGETHRITEADRSFDFTLKHGQTITFSDLPIGAALTVTEEPEEGSGYVISVDGEPGTGKTVTLGEINADIVFDNRKNVTVDTGVLLDAVPYILLLAMAAAGVIFLIHRRPDREDEETGGM